MRRSARCTAAILLAALAGGFGSVAEAAEPDYAAWDELLAAYHSVGQGMDYAGLRREDKARLDALRRRLAATDVETLDRDERLAFWINLYNVSVVGIVVDHYPIESIRDLSTDPITRLNVFRKRLVPFGGSTVSLDHIEHEIIRKEFGDARIHFAINCAARSCPPLREEAYRGARIHQQLDEQVRRFAEGEGVRIAQRRGRAVLTTTRIMKWFEEDFEKAGGKVAFLLPYLPPGKRRIVAGQRSVAIEYAPYDWSLNDWRR